MSTDDMLPGLQVILRPGRYTVSGSQNREVRYSGNDYGYRGGYRGNSEPEKNVMSIDYGYILELLQHQEVLDTSLAVLTKNHKPHSDTEDTKQALESARTSAIFLRRHVGELYDVIPLHERPPTTRSGLKAEEVFSTPELLELIMFAGLSTREKLQAMRVNRCWRDTVKGSATLKQSLGLSLSPDPFYYTPFSKQLRGYDWEGSGDLPGGARFSDRLEGGDEERGYNHYEGPSKYPFNKVIFEVLYHRNDETQAMGSRVQSMTICNPPIFDLNVILRSQCSCNWGTQNEVEYMDIHSTSVLGFTVGELARRRIEIQGRKPQCSRCDMAYGVEFMGSVMLLASDPLAMAHNKELDEQREELRRANERASKCKAERKSRGLPSYESYDDGSQVHLPEENWLVVGGVIVDGPIETTDDSERFYEIEDEDEDTESSEGSEGYEEAASGQEHGAKVSQAGESQELEYDEPEVERMQQGESYIVEADQRGHGTQGNTGNRSQGIQTDEQEGGAEDSHGGKKPGETEQEGGAEDAQEKESEQAELSAKEGEDSRWPVGGPRRRVLDCGQWRL